MLHPGRARSRESDRIRDAPTMALTAQAVALMRRLIVKLSMDVPSIAWKLGHPVHAHPFDSSADGAFS